MDDSNITSSLRVRDGKWCCRSGHEDCVIEKYHEDMGYEDVILSVRCSGKTLPRSQQCHDGDNATPVCNYVHTNPARNNFWDAKIYYLDVCKDNM